MSMSNNTGAGSDATLLKQIREFTDSAIKGDNGNRLEAVADLKFLAGDQWPENIKRERQLQKRPCLTFNRLPTYLHQVTNDQRQDQVGIQVHPVGEGADKKGAEIYQGMIRRIEDSSNADVAYDTAVNSAAGIGFGFWRLITEYESATSFNQVIKFQRMRDALKVYFDPASVEADGSDAKQCVIVSDMPKAEFERTYPGKLDACRTAVHAIGNQVQPGW
ncbi:MAG: portal protein, partial [Massilia sp.]